jgi:hypothetical protein
MSSFDVTRRELILGDLEDPDITGWYLKDLTSETTIKMVILPKGSTIIGLPTGNYAKYEHTGFTANVIDDGDEIIDANGTYYEVKTHEPAWWLDTFSHYICSLVAMPIHYDLPTYGTGATVEDPRRRTKVWIDQWLDEGNLLKNDGVTPATSLVSWINPPYPIQKVFQTKERDIAFAVGRGTSKPMIDGSQAPYGYEEKISIFPTTIDKTGISGDNLMWQGERELRRIAEEHPLSSLRGFDTMASKTQSLGSTTLYSVECALNYIRDKT